MKTVLQRVSEAKVTVDGKTVGEIGRGLLILVGFDQADTADSLDFHCRKIRTLRIFADDTDKMNHSVTDIQGGLLVVSQFTLAGDCSRGSRPGFDNALAPDKAKTLYQQFVEKLRADSGLSVATGEFGAMMQVSLVNDGPVTFLLENPTR